MPIFEYQCQHCGHVFEVFIQRATGGDAPKCRKCGSPKVDRVLSAFSGRVGGGTGCAPSPSGTG